MSRDQASRASVSRADQLEESGDLESAIAVLTDGIREDPADPSLFARRGRLFKLRKQWRAAIADFDTALGMKPDAATTLFFRGQCRATIADFDGAITDFERCIRIQPASADAHWEIGVIHGFRGDLARAIAAYRTAFELDPTYAGLPDVIAELEREREQRAKDE